VLGQPPPCGLSRHAVRPGIALCLIGWWTAMTAAAEVSPKMSVAVIVCQRTFSCATWLGARLTSCADAIGGTRLFRDQSLFVLSPADQIAKLDGGAIYRLEIRKNTLRLSYQRLMPFAAIDRESVIDRATGTLSGRTTIRYRGDAKVVEFRFTGRCAPLAGSIAPRLSPSPAEGEAASVSQ